MGLMVGIDAGGTFTDLIARDLATGAIYSHKLSSTPHDPAEAIIRGIDELIERHALTTLSVDLIAHGTTVGTNTLLQRKGARVAMVTTKGFRDLLEIGRQTRPANYNMHLDFPAPVIPRHRRIELAERIGADGAVVTTIDAEELEQALEAALASKPESIAVCFLFSYLNPSHELAVKQRIQDAAPDLFVSTSSEVQPEFREYERISTTALNAYLQPVMARYLGTLERRLSVSRPKAHIAISRSNGGLMSLPLARQFPIRTALSGPAAGVVGAIDVQRSARRPKAITFDMGGTSADVALVKDCACSYRHRSDIGGFPIRMSMLDIHTVGAGGGSIAWLDRDDLLKVGPLSAGADPGPACYGFGGENATVTDANLVLGRLSPDGLLGGSMQLHPELARTAVSRVAGTMGFTVEQSAQGIIDIVTSSMVRAIRAITVERGFDPRDFTLLAFGGAGPLHARQVAGELGMTEILVPLLPGILCAQGALASTFKEDIVRTIRQELQGPDALAALAAAIERLVDDAGKWCVGESLDPASLSFSVILEMRYVGQNFELPIPLFPSEIRVLPAVEKLRARFFEHHERQYGFHSESGPVEVVNIRLTAEVQGNQAAGAPGGKGRAQPGRPLGRRVVWFAGNPVQTPVYDRSSLVPGQSLTGPAVIEQADTTTLLFPGDRLTVDDNLNLMIGLSA
jgi:N-methylhydantoinase A